MCVMWNALPIRTDMWKCRISPLPASVHGIVHGTFVYRKVSGCWVPKQLREYHIQMHMGLCLVCLMWYESTSGALVAQIITGDETWLCLVTLETKMDSMIRKHKHPVQWKSSEQWIVFRIMASVIWVARGVLLLEFLLTGETISAVCFYTTLDRLREAVQRKRAGWCSCGVPILHDHAIPHTAWMTKL
jgi:hypothetical protein